MGRSLQDAYLTSFSSRSKTATSAKLHCGIVCSIQETPHRASRHYKENQPLIHTIHSAQTSISISSLSAQSHTAPNADSLTPCQLSTPLMRVSELSHTSLSQSPSLLIHLKPLSHLIHILTTLYFTHSGESSLRIR